MNHFRDIIVIRSDIFKASFMGMQRSHSDERRRAGFLGNKGHTTGAQHVLLSVSRLVDSTSGKYIVACLPPYVMK